MLKPALLGLVVLVVHCDVTGAWPSQPITNSHMSGNNRHDPALAYDVTRYRTGRPNAWGNGGDAAAAAGGAAGAGGAGGSPYNSNNNRGDDGGRAYNSGPPDYNSLTNNGRNEFNRGAAGSGKFPPGPIYPGATSGNNRDINFTPSGSQILPGISSHVSSADNQNQNWHRRPLPTTNTQFVDPNKPITMMSAFTGCETHENYQYSNAVGDNFEIKSVPLKQNSHIAVYPLSDSNSALYVTVMMPTMQYKAKVQGSNVNLAKCSNAGTECVVEDEKSTKSSNLIVPQQWNYVYSQVKHGGITIGVGETVEVMSMSSIPREDLENAEWLVSSNDGFRSDGGGQDGGPFVVQYPCAEYVANHLPDPEVNPDFRNPSTHKPNVGLEVDATPKPPHFYPGLPDGYYPSTRSPIVYTGAPIIGHTTDHPSKSSCADGSCRSSSTTSAIVVGVIVALLIVLLVVAISVSVYKKRQAAMINESTPLSEQKSKQEAMQQEQQVSE